MADPAQVGPPTAGAKGEIRVTEPTRLERTVARRSAESRATVPTVELEVEVKMDRALAVAARTGSEVTTVLVRACAQALAMHPRANGAYRDGRFERYRRVNVGLVLANESTYTIATVFDAERKPLSELGAELTDLTSRGARGELSAPELGGATFTFWDAGQLGLSRASALVVPPQAAALTAGAVRPTPAMRDGVIIPANLTTLSLACDHRIMYGAVAASFLTDIKMRLEEGTG